MGKSGQNSLQSLFQLLPNLRLWEPIKHVQTRYLQPFHLLWKVDDTNKRFDESVTNCHVRVNRMIRADQKWKVNRNWLLEMKTSRHGTKEEKYLIKGTFQRENSQDSTKVVDIVRRTLFITFCKKKIGCDINTPSITAKSVINWFNRDRVTRLGDFLTLGNFLRPFATVNLPKSSTFLGNH